MSETATAPKHDIKSGLPIALALAVALALAALAFTRVTIRTDMADFLPSGGSAAARLMIEQIRNGAAARLIMIGVDHAAPEQLARISAALRESLDRSGLFVFVENGAEEAGGADEALLFRYRYLLSPVTTPEAFSVPALHADLERLLEQLASSAAPLVEQYGLADPPGAFFAIARDFVGASRVRTRDGVWFAADRDRALLLLKTRAGGVDLAAQQRVAEAIQRGFQVANPGGARPLVSGAAVFARDAANQIRADVWRISLLSTAAIAALLLWRFRSLWVLAAIAIPLAVSVAIGLAAVQLAFGYVHGVTLGFGMTMLGVTVDYPVLLIGHRKQGEPAHGTIRRIGAALTLAVITASLGLTGMLFSGFPGLSQLGLFSITGILVGFAVTRFGLPPLIVAAGLAPVAAGSDSRLLRMEGLRAFRLWALVPIAAAALYLAVIGGPRDVRDLARLSPVPAHDLALDAQLRLEIGAPDAGQLILVKADSLQAVLQDEESLLPLFDHLEATGVISGAEIAARYLPSVRAQRQRQSFLPDAATLRARLREAAAGMPFRPDAFNSFVEQVEASRTLPPLKPADLTTPLLASRLEPLLFERGGAAFGVIAPAGVSDPPALARALAGRSNLTYVDVATETNAMVAAYTRQAWQWLAVGGGAALVALIAGLRDWRVVRVAGTVVGAAVVTVALLAVSRTRLSLFNIVALQLAIGVGLDYALFFARRQLDEEERARTLRTLVTCNAMTLLTFGLLAFCRTPLLRSIGVTVAIGVISAILLAFLLVGPRPAAVRE